MAQLIEIIIIEFLIASLFSAVVTSVLLLLSVIACLAVLVSYLLVKLLLN